MNIRSPRLRERTSVPAPALYSQASSKFFSNEEFQFEIAKEVSRSNRRPNDREFAILRFSSIAQRPWDDTLSFLVEQIQQRIRISDTVGWLKGELAVLLPETGRPGAITVANSIAKRFAETGTGVPAVEMDIDVYPWDDELISLSYELNKPHAPPVNGVDAEEFRFDDSKQTADNNSDDNGFENHSSPTNGIVATLEKPPLETPVANKPQLNSVFQMKPAAQPSGDRENRLDCFGTRIVGLQATPILKRAVDVVGAGIGLALLTPFLAAAAVAIKTTSRGPIFFVQQREGKDGKVFGILKFRTMIKQAEQMQDDLRHISEQDGPAFKLAKDPRVTRIGRFLRKSCIDELPQLWNVLVGEMSLVGPRPLPVGESYGCKAWHRARLTVLPGLTCTWQASGRRTKIEFDEWMRMDLDYIQKQSFWFDLKLLARTAMIALMYRGSV